MRWVGLFLLCAVAHAQDAADQVLAAAKAKDTETLARFAKAESPDPWFIAEELCKRGEFDAALAFAGSRKHIDLERLPEYIALRREKSRSEEEANALSRVLDERDPRRMVKLHAELPERDDVGGALADQRAAKAWRKLRNASKSVELFRRAGERGARIGWVRLEVSSWNLLANVLLRAQAFEEAAAYFDRAARIQRRRGDKPREILNLRGVGAAQRRAGDLIAAITARERARELELELGRGQGAARSLEVIGLYHSELGNLPESRRVFQATAEEYGKLGFELGRASAIDQLASTCSQLGDFDTAQVLWEEALAIAARLKEKTLQARVLGNQGIGMRRRGDFAAAIDAYEESLGLKRAVKDVRGEAITLSNLGSLYSDLGEYARALRKLEDALEIHRRAKARVYIAGIYSAMAGVQLEQGDYDASRASLEHALKICRAGRLRVIESKCLINLSNLERLQGNLGPAREAIRLAREAKEEIHDSVGVAVTYLNEATIEGLENGWDRAAELYAKAYAAAAAAGAYEALVRSEAGLAQCRLRLGQPTEAMNLARSSAARAQEAARMLPVTHAAATRSRYAPIFHTGTAAAFQARDAAGFLEFAEQARATSLLESMGGALRLRATDLPKEMRASEDRARAERELAVRELRRAVAKGKRSEARKAKASLDAAEEKLQALAERSQRALRRQGSVAYPRFCDLAQLQNVLSKDEAFLLYASLEDEFAALVVTASGVRMKSLGSIVDDSIELATAAADPSRPVPTGLTAKLIDPLELKATRLLISPDGILSYVPFALLAPGREVVFVPSASTLVMLRGAKREPGKGVLALGDPAQARLPSSGAEAKAIGDVVLLGDAASRTQLLATLKKQSRWRALHFACHGVLHADRPLLSALELSGGHLTVLDIYRLTVPADLVALSACETAKGKLYRADGVIGLTRAFMQAGAPRILASLWKVDDAATRALMEAFYGKWKAGAAPAAALLAAQTAVRAEKKWRHPSFWAAWQLWGLPE
ncbi:MAG: CHAT domain-containing protein [Planctomycetota bacterium]|jgi:CHAT domain-containing protein/tetratricopeptide (TPR) repeat protein